MKIFIIVFSVFILSLACNKDQRTDQNTGSKKDSASQTKQNIQATTNSASTTQNADSSDKNAIENLVYDTGKLSDEIKYNGKIVAGARWNDKNGENIVIITETPVKGQPGDSRMKELFGYNYTLNSGDTKLLWKINDFVKDCPVDINLKYVDNSLSITDLDNNGIAESSFIYRMSCKGDVSPDDMKLLMHEGETKYAIRGQMKLTIKDQGTYGGEMKIDPSFDKAPKEFLDFAKDEWNKYKDEKAGY